MKYHVIYVPGIGDSRALGQDKGIGWWRVLGVVPHYHPVGWATKEPYADKLKRLTKQIDAITAAGGAVVLIGFSAGASAVLNAFAARKDKISAVILISGWLRPPSATNPRYFIHNPAFKESLQMLQSSLAHLSEQDKQKMLTLNPVFDPVVPLKDGTIIGVECWRTFAFGHVGSIATALTVYAWAIVRHLKRLAK